MMSNTRPPSVLEIYNPFIFLNAWTIQGKAILITLKSPIQLFQGGEHDVEAEILSRIIIEREDKYPADSMLKIVDILNNNHTPRKERYFWTLKLYDRDMRQEILFDYEVDGKTYNTLASSTTYMIRYRLQPLVGVIEIF